MLAADLITNDIPPLKNSDTGLKALTWMEEFKVSHLPIIDNNEYLGMISDSDILDMNAPDEPIGSHHASLIRPFVSEHDHLYEVINLVQKINISLITVLDKENRFLGTITLPNLVKAFAGMSAVNEPGGVIILEMNHHDYVLSEIARIVEGNDAKILSCSVTSSSDSTQLEVTVKINKKDLRPILQTFTRYNYNIKASFHQSEFPDEFQDRYDSFMNFLNI
jgi:acetoin utilization protein AcuB